MFQATVTVKNATGLHARPASQFVALCQKFSSSVKIVSHSEEYNAKSIISLLSAGIKQGTTLQLLVEGDDEETAGNAIVDFINNVLKE